MELKDSIYRVITRGRDCKDAPFIQEVVKTILGDLIDELYILRSINGQNTMTYKEDPVRYISIEDRFMGTEDHAEFRINSVTSNYDKVARDINMIMNVVKEGYYEIIDSGTCDSFELAADFLKRMNQDEIDLLQSKEKSEKTIENLKNKYEEERLLNIGTIEETNAKIQKLRFQVEDTLVYGAHEVDYFEKWENARREQNQMSCEDSENYYRNMIKDMQNKIDLENRCHQELESFMDENRNDCMEGIQNWMKQYDEETELRDYDILQVKADLEKTADDLQLIEEKYKTQVEDIKNWLEYKRIKKEKEDREKLILWATIKLQAWWRGVMYRKKLGPYRRKKKKGKGKGDKKGTKKGFPKKR